MSTQLAIHALLNTDVSLEQIRDFLRAHSFPVVEGEQVTFVWFGSAHKIYLRHWVYGLETSTELQRVENTDLWYLILEIPCGSRVEYKFEVHDHNGCNWRRDPLNDRLARDPFGANSVLEADGYELPGWIHHDPDSRPGDLQTFSMHSTVFNDERVGHIYLPARMRKNRRYPLLVIHDGSDFLRYANMKTVLDNLIHRLEIPDLIAVFIDSPDRLSEYANHPDHACYVTEELVPWIAERFPILDHPSARCLMGASFGGVASFSTAWRYPGFWGRLLLQSGSFAFTDIGRRNRRGPLFDRVVEFVNEYRAQPRAVSERVFVSCGMYESLIYENRSMIPLLNSTGMQVRFVESRDGHNWENWRDRSRGGLTWLLPGPLMFIYE
jgi:enterochelin esterase family protein